MDIKYLQRLLGSPELVKEKIEGYLTDKSLKQEQPNQDEIKGHLAKSDHNLKFVNDNLNMGYYDWCITGCYYAVYQAALALIIAKGFFSKNHDATLCILIKEYYKNILSEEEIQLINMFFLDYQEIIFYVESKNKREEATYSTKIKFDKQLVSQLRIKAALFVDKAKQILKR